MTSTTLYLPSCLRTATSLRDRRYGRPSLPEHLHRLHQARSHAVERSCESRDLVLALAGEFRGVQIAEADLVGDPRQPGDGPDHDGMKHEVEGDEDEGEDPAERDHEYLESVVCALDGQGHGDGHYLRPDYLVQLPAEAVRRTVEFDHGLGRCVHGAVAIQAGGVLDLQGPGHVQGTAGRCVALADDLDAIRRLAELVHDVGFPIGGAVAGIGWIQSRFLVVVIGEFLAQVAELLVGGVRGNRLRQELVLNLRLEQRAHLLGGVAAYRERRFHHDTGVLEHLVARVLPQQVERYIGGDGQTDQENCQKHHVELDDQSHDLPSYRCVPGRALFGSPGSFGAYFSGNRTLSHSGCSRRFSISLRRNSGSLDRISNRLTRFLLIAEPALSQASTSAYVTSCSRLGSDLLFLNRSSNTGRSSRNCRGMFFTNSDEGREPRVAGCSPLRTMNSPPFASRAILCTPFLPISENLTAPDSTYMSVEPSPAFRTAVVSPAVNSARGVR